MTATRPPTRRAAPVHTHARPRPQPPRRVSGPEGRVPPIAPSLLLLGLGLALIGAALSSRFTVRHVTVVGRNLPTAAIVAAAGVEGQNIFTVRSDQVVSRLDSVRQVVIRRVDMSFPDGVTIYARRRVPMVAWRRGTALYLLDPDGRIIQRVTSTGLPVIMSTGNEPSLSPGVVEAVREAVRLVSPAPHGAIASFTYDPRNGLTIAGTAGWQAIVGNGSPQTTVTRIATLAAYLQKTADRSELPKVVDLRFPVSYATN